PRSRWPHRTRARGRARSARGRPARSSPPTKKARRTSTLPSTCSAAGASTTRTPCGKASRGGGRPAPGARSTWRTSTCASRCCPFYCWSNAAVQVGDASRLIYPMELTAAHGFTEVDTWPVDRHGTDLSRPGNHTKGAVSLFSHGTREPFMGVYHPRTRAGVVHYADPAELPAKKVWSWGADAEGLDWRRALSDDGSAEVEIQAGLFRNQETYAFLDPQESIHFREYWLPVREIGGFSRANAEAVVHVTRET